MHQVKKSKLHIFCIQQNLWIKTLIFSLQIVRSARSNWRNGKIWKAKRDTIKNKIDILQVSIVTLCFISIDRYNAIVYPLDTSRGTQTNMRFFTRSIYLLKLTLFHSRSYITILFIWGFALLLCGKIFQSLLKLNWTFM